MKYLFTLICSFLSYSMFSQNPENLIKLCEDVYRKTEFYQDSGRVFVEIYNTKFASEKALYFKTSYSQSGLFSIEYYQSGNSNSLFTTVRDSTGKTKSWWGVTQEIDDKTELDHVLSGQHGVSSTVSTNIPNLLFSDSTAYYLFKTFKPTKPLEFEKIKGENCYKIYGKRFVDDETIYWISTSTLLIKKIFRDTPVTNFRVRTTYDYSSYTPIGISKDNFIFRPFRKVKL
jgi:hypothetical protein